MDKSPTKTTVSSNTNRIWKITTCLFLSTTVIFVSLFIWSEYKGDTNSGNQGDTNSGNQGDTNSGNQGTPCDNYSCDNGGTCFLDEFQPKCACKYGFIGENCTSPCESGWFYLPRSTCSNCYFFSPTATDWEDARQACMNHDAKLAEPDTQSEIDYISGIASSMKDTFWIGGTDKDDEGTFVWASDNRNVTLFNWSDGEPNDASGEDCVDMHVQLEFLWNDSGCERQSRFVCEKQPLDI